jgi:hypothetical protein
MENTVVCKKITVQVYRASLKEYCSCHAGHCSWSCRVLFMSALFMRETCSVWWRGMADGGPKPLSFYICNRCSRVALYAWLNGRHAPGNVCDDRSRLRAMADLQTTASQGGAQDTPRKKSFVKLHFFNTYAPSKDVFNLLRSPLDTLVPDALMVAWDPVYPNETTICHL